MRTGKICAKDLRYRRFWRTEQWQKNSITEQNISLFQFGVGVLWIYADNDYKRGGMGYGAFL